MAACAPTPDPSAELVQMQDRLLRAVLEGRRDDYAAMLHDDWRVTHVDGRLRTKAQVLDDLFGGETPVVSGAVNDVEVRVYGEAAVATGRSAWTARSGESFELRFTDVAIRRNGRWRIVASHATAIEAQR
jgi:hypothetical protein